MDDAPLGKLAAELRNNIYELVLIQEKPFRVTAPHQDARNLRLESDTKRPLALLGACRQIRQECSKLFYANNTFELETLEPIEHRLPDDMTLLQPFMSAIGLEKVQSLRRLVVVMTGSESAFTWYTKIKNEQAERGVWPQIRPLRRFVLEHPKVRLEVEFKLNFEVQYFEKPETMFKVDMRDLADSARMAEMEMEEELIPYLREFGPLYGIYGDNIDGMSTFLGRLQVLASSSWNGAEPR